MSRLLLIDGSSFLYRAFYALPNLTSPAGLPTGAIYGMGEMLKKLRTQYPAEHIACVFDAPGKTFRDDIFPEYKAQRPSMPEDLRRQIEPIHAMVSALGWPVLQIKNVEADDVIATLATRYCKDNSQAECIIATGDKDLAQLVTPQVWLVNTMNNEMLQSAEVEKKFGIPPSLIVDYLCLTGDAVDGVPGVEKVGPKTAVKWLKEYGSLEHIIQNAEKISGTVGENLRRHIPWFDTARELLTVKRDCDLGADFAADLHQCVSLQAQMEDVEKLRVMAQEWGFKTWIKTWDTTTAQSNQSTVAQSRYSAEKPNPMALQKSDSSHYQIVNSNETFEALLHQLADAQRDGLVVAFDTETTGLDPLRAQLVGMSFCMVAGTAYYLPIAHNMAEQQLSWEHILPRLRPWLESPQAYKVGQNIRFDLHILANHGVNMAGVRHDTQLQSYVLASDARHDLDSLAKQHLGLDPISYESLCGKGAQAISFADVALADAAHYAAEDADITQRLHLHLLPQVVAHQGLHYIYEKVELPLIMVLWRMERNGVMLDRQALRQQSQELGVKMLALEQEVSGLAGHSFNLNSPKQLAHILFEEMGIPVVKKTSGGVPSTDEEVLQKLSHDHPIAARLLDYRTIAKLKSTYTDKLAEEINPVTGRVHTSYSQSVAVTGRLASNNPNLQNIPIRTPEGRRVRDAFIAPAEKKIISADYSQIELRLMAHLSQDSSLLKAFREGRDIHQATAAEIFQIPLDAVTSSERRYAKTINFGLIYGMSAFGLASSLGIERQAAQNYIDQYFQRYPGVARYMENTKLAARANGYVETILGRRLWLREINSSHAGRRQGSERAAINAPMQGSAADYIKLAMITVDSWIITERLSSRLLMQVHDELVLEVPEEEVTLVQQRLPQLMAGVADLLVPLTAEVGVGQNWNAAH